MSKLKMSLLTLGGAVGVFAPMFMVAHAQTYLITATDTLPVFQAGAQAVKDNGLAVLNVAVPYLAGAAVAFSIILIIWVVVSYFRSHRA